MYEDPNKITFFATTNARGKETPFGIKRRDRARHMYIIGKTGMGKSTLLENMAIQDIRNGEGLAFIDPHGGTADRIMEYVPADRIKDVLYFAPFDMEHPVAFNVMEDVGYDKRHLVVSGLLSAFRKIWVDAWSARMEYILSNTLLALLEYEGSTLLDINRMLINKAFRKKVVENVTDPIVKSFWVDEFANYTDRYTQDATPAIQNKVGQFTSNPLIRNIVGQAKSSFDIRKMMDEKKILIINLSKGRVGEVNATLLGSMLVTKIYLAAMSRADISADTLSKLPSFYFYVDEFQNFANESFSDILSEARKYKLNLIIAHQYVEQMEEEVRDAVFGNVGTTVAFRVGPFDAETLEKVFEPQFTATDLVNLGFAQIYLTLMIDGVGSQPFSATTIKPFDPPPQNFFEQVIESSRLSFAKPRADVEQVITEWQGSDPPNPPEPKAKRDYAPKTGDLRTPKPAVASKSTTPVVFAAAPSAPLTPSDPTLRRGGQSFAPRTEPSPTAVVEHSAISTSSNKQQPSAQAEHRAHEHATGHESSSPKERVREPDAERARAPRPKKPFAERTPKPPLEGTNSLKEALARATGRKVDPEVESAPTVGLKDMLGKIAPQATNHQKVREEQPVIEKKDTGLPEEVLRAMLAVDEPKDITG